MQFGTFTVTHSLGCDTHIKLKREGLELGHRGLMEATVIGLKKNQHQLLQMQITTNIVEVMIKKCSHNLHYYVICVLCCPFKYSTFSTTIIKELLPASCVLQQHVNEKETALRLVLCLMSFPVICYMLSRISIKKIKYAWWQKQIGCGSLVRLLASESQGHGLESVFKGLSGNSRNAVQLDLLDEI